LVIGSSCILGTETEPDTTTSALAETLLPWPWLGEPETFGGFQYMKVFQGATRVSLALWDVAVLYGTGAGLLNWQLQSWSSPQSRAGKPEGGGNGDNPTETLSGSVSKLVLLQYAQSSLKEKSKTLPHSALQMIDVLRNYIGNTR
jgi:hypothetical protein